MRVAVKIELSDADRQRLERLSRSRSAAMRLRERSRMVLMAAGGNDEQGDRREAGNRPEQGRAVEAAVRGRGAGRDCEGASAGVATTAARTRWPRRR